MIKTLKVYVFFLTAMCFAAVPTLPPREKREIIHQSVSLDLIKHLSISGNYHIKIQQGPNEALISGTADAITKTLFSEDKNELKISSSGANFFTKLFNFRSSDDSADVMITLSVPIIPSLSAHGNTHVTVADNVMLKNVRTSGNSKVNINSSQHPTTFQATLSGNSHLSISQLTSEGALINVRGSSMIDIASTQSAKDFSINLSGSSRANIASVAADKVRTASKGASKLNINEIAAKSTEVNLSGSARIAINSLITKFFTINQKGQSYLEINKGNAKSTTVSKKATFAFNQFSPGSINRKYDENR